jgi:hypothetical protein
MKLPTDKAELFGFYVELNNKCNATREERRKLYEGWRSYFLYGDAPVTSKQPINKIYSHIDQLTALMYSGETTRFSIDLSVSASDLYKAKLGPMMRLLNDNWHDANTDLIFGTALQWAHCYGSMFVKMRVNQGQIEPYVVEPGDFGVLREDIGGLHRQEAFSHSYYVTESQLRYDLEACEHPRREEILKAIIAVPKPTENANNAVLDQIITSQSQPNMIGNVNFSLDATNKYRPTVSEKLIQMSELYVFDDEIHDLRIVTMADPGVVIFDRPINGVFIKKEAPFVQVCPNPAHDYFWGHSEVDKLIPLQIKRNERMEQIDHMLSLQARPPKFGSGFNGDISEIADTMDTPSGVVSADMPGAKMDSLAPNIPEDLYKEIREIDGMFEEMSGITNVIQGKGEQGVRSQGHAANLARLGSSRAKKRALIVEDQLEKVATLFMKLLQAYCDDKMRSEDGLSFIAEQFDSEYIVKVDAHSNSPIFQEDQRELAFQLFKVKAIDRESLLDLLDVPMKELLKQRLSKLEAAEQKAKEAEQAAIAQGGGKKGSSHVKAVS